MPKYDLMDLGGGLNEGDSPTKILDNQMAELNNFYPQGKRLIRRNGSSLLTTAPYGQNLTSVFALKQSNGVWTVIVGSATGLARLSGNQIVTVPTPDGVPFAGSGFPWDFHQYKDVGYAMREGVGLRRFGPDFIHPAGIPEPAGAPAIADGAAGLVEAGDYYPVFTYANSDNGNESNPSPVGVKLTHAGSKVLDWSVIGISPTPQVNSRRLYRTLPNQRGEYFFVAALNDNVTTTYTDNVVINDLGTPVSLDNGMPPPGLLVGDIWKERLFATDGVDLFFSEQGLMECFGEESILAVYPDDGHSLRSVTAFGDRLIVGKTNKVHFVVSTGPRAFALQTLSDRHGIYSHYSVKVAEAHLFWYGGDDAYSSDGAKPYPIGSVRIRKTLDAIPDDRKQYVVGAIYAPLNWYLLSVPQGASGSNNQVVLAFNYKDGTWAKFKHPSDAPSFLGELFDPNYGQIIYATFYDGNLYRYNDPSAGTDWGNPILATLRTKALGLDRHGLLKTLRRLYLLATSTGRTITIKLYRDGSLTALKSRTVSLDQTTDWKVYSLNTSGAPGATLQIGIEYQGDSQIELDEMALDVAEFMRNRMAA